MANRTSFNILMNGILAAAFVFFNGWALQQGLEETFVVLAICYGFVTIVLNAAFIAITWPRSAGTAPR